ncbi:hypothetical protein AnigIFM60653_001212 [Aspergillus niger]|nr:hypothetical protein AlacWU_05532 [Aspergillus niger]GKZ82321.1 hypothetical protein AnigIFM56816_007131 [Aspergillus niger]GKZ97327.1 hypothetical protein AnigIFM59636_000708 [Aspergillus niger]GLA01921.1 hypothetical protein AnigIFM60653_001212 [Aspergillus niger]GLA11627.1 hypothetical protein AnigIFM62618_005596 [Aspergillus niger]
MPVSLLLLELKRVTYQIIFRAKETAPSAYAASSPWRRRETLEKTLEATEAHLRHIREEIEEFWGD